MKLGNSPISKLFVFVMVMMVPLMSRADLLTILGNGPQPNEQNVMFNDTQTGSTVWGVTNITGTQVSFSSSTDTLAVNSSGQAAVTSGVSGDLVNQLTISTPGTSFADLIINPQIPNPSSGLTGPWDLMVTLNTTTGTFQYIFPSSGKDALGVGNNFITFLATNGTMITSVDLTSTSGFDSLTQVRLSGVGVTATPEPASVLLMGLGLSGLAFGLTRYRKQHLR